MPASAHCKERVERQFHGGGDFHSEVGRVGLVLSNLHPPARLLRSKGGVLTEEGVRLPQNKKDGKAQGGTVKGRLKDNVFLGSHLGTGPQGRQCWARESLRRLRG